MQNSNHIEDNFCHKWKVSPSDVSFWLFFGRNSDAPKQDFAKGSQMSPFNDFISASNFTWAFDFSSRQKEKLLTENWSDFGWIL